MLAGKGNGFIFLGKGVDNMPFFLLNLADQHSGVKDIV